MFKYKKGDKVWANIKSFNSPWRKGYVLGSFKSVNRGNIYNFRPSIGGHGFEVMERDLQEADQY